MFLDVMTDVWEISSCLSSILILFRHNIFYWLCMQKCVENFGFRKTVLGISLDANSWTKKSEQRTILKFQMLHWIPTLKTKKMIQYQFGLNQTKRKHYWLPWIEKFHRLKLMLQFSQSNFLCARKLELQQSKWLQYITEESSSDSKQSESMKLNQFCFWVYTLHFDC